MSIIVGNWREMWRKHATWQYVTIRQSWSYNLLQACSKPWTVEERWAWEKLSSTSAVSQPWAMSGEKIGHLLDACQFFCASFLLLWTHFPFIPQNVSVRHFLLFYCLQQDVGEKILLRSPLQLGYKAVSRLWHKHFPPKNSFLIVSSSI